MTTMLHDYMIIDGTDEAEDSFEYHAALQRQINSGTIWHMQGACGRAAMDAITAGACLCAFVGSRDYWGNYVPARSDLKPGTKGTHDYVRERMGEEWAAKMAAIGAQ